MIKRKLHSGKITVDTAEEAIESLMKQPNTVYTKQDIDFAFLMGAFNVGGIEGLLGEIQRLKSIGKHPHDIFTYVK